MKRQAIDHTKMDLLMRKLNLPRWGAVGILESLWHLTAKEAPRGDIGRLSNERIAIGIEWRGAKNSQPESEANRLVQALVEAGWMEVNDMHRFVIHDWHEHADEAVKKYLKRNNLEFARLDMSRQIRRLPDTSSLPVPEPVPLPEPAPEEIHDAPVGACLTNGNGYPKKRRKASRTIAEMERDLGPERLPWWEHFWEVFPCHDGKNEGMDVFERKVHTKELATQIWRAAKEYGKAIAANPDRSVKWAQGWLNKERWNDENLPNHAPVKPQQKSFMGDVERVMAENMREKGTPW